MKCHEDTFGLQDPIKIAQRRAEIAEYDSYLPVIDGNGGTGSTKVLVPKVAKRTVHVPRKEDV